MYSSSVKGYWTRRHSWVASGHMVTCIIDNRTGNTQFFYQPLKYMS